MAYNLLLLFSSFRYKPSFALAEIRIGRLTIHAETVNLFISEHGRNEEAEVQYSYEFLLVGVTEQVARRVDKGSRPREACRGQ